MINRDKLLSSAPVDIASERGQLIVLGREVLRLRRHLRSILLLAHHQQYQGATPENAFVDAQLLNSMFCECGYQARVALDPGHAGTIPGEAQPAWDRAGSCHQAAAILGGDLFAAPDAALPPAPAQDRITADWRRKQAEGWAAWQEMKTLQRAAAAAMPARAAEAIDQAEAAQLIDMNRALYADGPKAPRRLPLWLQVPIVVGIAIGAAYALVFADRIGAAIGRAIKAWLS